jgi:cytochrome c oxidase subunit 3
MAQNFTFQNIEQPTPTLGMNPKKFALWLFMVTVVMLFGAMTSAYIFKQAEGDWLFFDLPKMFYISTGVIILSSASMHWAYLSAKKDELGQLKTAMMVTFALGAIFFITQFLGFGQLIDNGIFFAGKTSRPAGSFVYIFSTLHMAHLLGGIIFLFVVLIKSFRLKIHAKNMLSIEMCASYWHFLDALWVYLFIFLLINNQAS